MLYSIDIGNKDDLSKILRSNRKIFNKTKKKQLIKKSSYEEIIDKKESLIINIKTENIIVGNSIAFIRNKNYHIWLMALDIDCIHQGIAKKILDMHKQIAKDSQFKTITMTVHDEQQDLARIVLQEGFKVYRKSLKESSKDYKIEF